MVRLTLIDLNTLAFKYHPVMISINKCNGSCNDLSPKIFVRKKTKDINVKPFNLINKNRAKTMA